MLIQALCDYYDLLAQAGKVLPDAYSQVRAHYRVCLTPEGEVEDIETWQVSVTTVDKKGKEKTTLEPHREVMFKRTEKPGIEANYVEHRPLYIFGLNLEKDGSLSPTDSTNKAAKSHQAFVERSLAFTEGIDTPIVSAFRQFVLRWKPEEQAQNPRLLGIGKAYVTAGFVFCLAGNPGVMLHNDPQLKARWDAQWSASEDEPGGVIGQCAITGQTAEIAQLHDKISGVFGGLATGTKLVCFKNDSEASYCAEQSINSNVSVAAMRKYTKALNYLLASPLHRSSLGDVTVVRFAMKADDRYEELTGDALFGGVSSDDAKLDATDTEKLLASIYADARNGVANVSRLLHEQDIDPDVSYYVVGLKPNAARIAVKFVYRCTVGAVVGNVALHQSELAMSADAKPLALWQLTKQLISPKSRNAVVDPALTAKLLEAIVNDYRYPPALLATVVRRVQTDSDDENSDYIKLNPTRAGIIKACLNRNARLSGKEEEIHMALDRSNTNPAYLCGRLFAVLEKIQQQANPGLNRTINDAYFSSASTRPAVIFPKLIKLAQYHLKKLDYARYWDRRLGEIIALLDNEYPDTLSLDDQGCFTLGYYQEKYAPSEKKQDDKQDEANKEGN